MGIKMNPPQDKNQSPNSILETPNKKQNSDTEDNLKKEIEEIRKEFSELLRDINWESQRRCMPYDWITYGHPHVVKLCELLKVHLSDGHLLKQDKRGSWR